jgi:gliding motility-associated-like protein
MRGRDLCGNDLISNIHTNVLLKGFKPGPYSVALNFTPYIGWGNANIRYDVYRKNGTSAYELKESNLTSFNVDYDDGLESYTQCYRIAATKLGTDTVSWSNEVCFNFDPVLFIPDAFSPNVDELNDQFFVKGGSLKTFEFMIYNRWGEKLFVANDINFRWDGKYNGEDQPQDVYMYICYYTGFDGRKYSTKGTITLLR